MTWSDWLRSRASCSSVSTTPLEATAEPAFRELMSRRMTQPRFANARSVRNALERARLRQANRLVSDGRLVTRDDLMRIDAADIYKSRWFTEAPGTGIADTAIPSGRT